MSTPTPARIPSTGTGLRTAASRPPAPETWWARLVSLWSGLPATTRRTSILVLVVFVLAAVGFTLHARSTRYVALYPTAVTATDLQDVAACLDASHISYSVESGKLMVPPDQRNRARGVLAANGLPRRSPVPDVESTSGLPLGRTDSERLERIRLERELVESLRQFDIVSDARVAIVPWQQDVIPGPGDTGAARATVLLTLKQGAQPARGQVQAILNLVSYSVRGLTPDQVRIADTSGRVWNDGQKIIGAGGDAARNDLLELKLATEQIMREKIVAGLTPMLGPGGFVVCVNTDLDFSRTKIVESRIADPAGTNTATTKRSVEKLVYDGASEAWKNQEAKRPSPAPSDRPVSAARGEHYVKIRETSDVQTGRVERTAILEPGAIRRVTTTVAINGQHSAGNLQAVRDMAASAVGHDASRGDDLRVHCYPFQPASPVAPVAEAGPVAVDAPRSSWLPYVLLAQVATLLGMLALFVHRSNVARGARSTPVLATATSTGVAGITDLETQRDGRSPATAPTARSPIESLDRVAREKPTKIAEFLRSTWLSERER